MAKEGRSGQREDGGWRETAAGGVGGGVGMEGEMGRCREALVAMEMVHTGARGEGGTGRSVWVGPGKGEGGTEREERAVRVG